MVAPNDDRERGGSDLDEAETAPRPAGAAGRADGIPVGLRRAQGPPLWAVFLGLAAAVFVADQLAKAWLVSFLQPGEAIQIVGDWLRLVHTHNSGALFGLFRDQAPVFAVVSSAVVGLIVWFHGRSGRSPIMSIALGLLLGGAIGNLTDRVRLGYVIDFVDGGIGDLRWYTFNVADAAISCALLLLILVSLRPSLARVGVQGNTESDREPSA